MKYYSCFVFIVWLMLVQCNTTTVLQHEQSALPQWERLGPGGGGSTFIPAFSFANDNEFLIRCDMTGSYLSKDGGQSYQLINVPNGAGSYAFDPFDSAGIYIGGTQLMHSANNGENWTALFPNENQIASTHYFGDHGNYSIEVKAGGHYPSGDVSINAVFIDPVKKGNIYFAINNWFYYSEDDGASFERIELQQPIQTIYSNKEKLKNEVCLFTSTAIFVFDKTTKKIRSLDIPADMQPVTNFAAGEVKSSDQTMIYALHDASNKPDQFSFGKTEVWVSMDMGKTWTVSKDEILMRSSEQSPSLAKIVCPLYDAASAYVVTNNIETKNENSTIAHWYGALKTTDGGSHWQWVWKGGGGSGQYRKADAKDAANLQDSWVTKAFGGEFIQLIDAGVSPYNADLAIVTDWYRSMKTVDGGKTWKEIYSIDNNDHTYTSRGLDVTTCYHVHADPFDSNHLAVSYTDIGLQHSFDNGHSWVRSVEGIPLEWNNTCYDLVFDPTIKNKIWSAWSGMHDIPRGKMTRNPNWKTSAVAKGGIALSVDGGKTWKPVINGMGDNSPATSIVMDIHSDVGNRTLYTTVYNKGVFKSTDDGQNWKLCNNGLDSNTAAFEITIAADGNLYLVVCPVPAFKNGEKGSAFYSGAVYKSTDGAASWKKLQVTANDLLFPSGLTTDSDDPNTIYLGCWANISLRDLVGSAVAKDNDADSRIYFPGGIYRSGDGGEHWQNIFDSTQYVYDLTVDPYHKGRLYCNTFNGAAYRSDDAGKQWKRLAGYDFHWGHRVMPDVRDTSKVYITTYGSGVWHGRPGVVE